MKKITPRAWTFFFAGIAVLSLVLLAASLSTLRMGAGHPFSFADTAPDIFDQNVSSETMRNLLAIFRVLMVIFWVLLPFYIILLIVSKEARKRLLRDLTMLLPIFILLYFLSRNQAGRNAAEGLNLRLFGPDSSRNSPGTQVPFPQFVPPPAWVTTAATIVIATSVTLILLGIFFLIWKRSKEQLYLRGSLRKVEKEAQAALDAIAAGGDLREAILRCYLQMVETLREYRGISRGQDMTPHEFEVFLQRRGIPGEPVHQLTHLFEEVRYGAVKPGRKDEQLAIASLSAIVSACQRAAAKQGEAHG